MPFPLMLLELLPLKKVLKTLGWSAYFSAEDFMPWKARVSAHFSFACE